MVTEFEQFLINRFSDERGYRFNNLFEWKGYNLDFKWMVDVLYNMFTDRNMRWSQIIGGKYVQISNFMFKQVCFLGRFDISVTIRTGKPENKIRGSYVNFDNSELAVYNDKNGKFTPYNPQTGNFFNPDDIVFNGIKLIIDIGSKTQDIPEYEFKAVCWHELMHAYQVYSELVKNRNKLPNSVETNNITYGNVIKKIQEYEKTGNSGMVKVAKVLYKLMQDEINANLSMIYPFIKKNIDINFSNITDYLPYLEIYKTVKLAEEVKDMMYKVIENEKYKNYVDSELYEIFSHRYKKEDCSKLLIKHLIKMIPYVQDKMYRNAKSALEDLGRSSMMEELDAKIGWGIV